MNFLDIGGLLAGSMTNPPALTFATKVFGSDGPAVAYATVYPLTMLLRILADQILGDAESRLRELANAVPAMIWISGTGMPPAFFFNRGWLDFVGDGQSQDEEDSWRQGIHPDDRERCSQDFETAFDARRKFS